MAKASKYDRRDIHIIHGIHGLQLRVDHEFLLTMATHKLPAFGYVKVEFIEEEKN